MPNEKDRSLSLREFWSRLATNLWPPPKLAASRDQRERSFYENRLIRILLPHFRYRLQKINSANNANQSKSR